ncbi:Ada metal-binding domain-containing protein [Sinomicrobium pectinilyticum]|nr:Ada metal-binding domain-containing protein [Sinomicrobium pectinilyticum]
MRSADPHNTEHYTITYNMLEHKDTPDALLHKYIRNGYIAVGGNKKLKIYGKLGCRSGKKMLRKNRVFFTSEQEAIHHGYRPCGHCMPGAYRIWKLRMEPYQ